MKSQKIKCISILGTQFCETMTFAIVVSLFVLFTWWGMTSVEKYWSEPLTTDIGYKFGDGIDNGIKFPVISFCQYRSKKCSHNF